MTGIDSVLVAWSGWIIGAVATAVSVALWRIDRRVGKLITMHGFGSAQMKEWNSLIHELNGYMREQAHYTKWLAEQMTGKKPPPPDPLTPLRQGSIG